MDFSLLYPIHSPLKGHCNVQAVIYEVKLIVEDEPSMTYRGQTLDFKKRYNNHMSSFMNRNCQQSCSLKDKVWDAQDRGKNYILEWNIIRRSKVYKPGGNMCGLCLDEKLAIQDVYDKPYNINVDNMIQRPCDHKWQYKVG